MPFLRSVSRFVLGSTLGLGVLVTGCALGSSPPPSSPPAARHTGPTQTTYATWEFDTIGELDQLLNVKGCEGWRLSTVFVRGDKIVAVLVADGTEPPASNPDCRLPA